jgi:hypothetical protein
MRIDAKNCQIDRKFYFRDKRKLEIAQDYVKIYRNKKLSARTSKSKQAYYRKQKKWENRVIKLKRALAYDLKMVEYCKRAGYL